LALAEHRNRWQALCDSLGWQDFVSDDKIKVMAQSIVSMLRNVHGIHLDMKAAPAVWALQLLWVLDRTYFCFAVGFCPEHGPKYEKAMHSVPIGAIHFTD